MEQLKRHTLAFIAVMLISAALIVFGNRLIRIGLLSFVIVEAGIAGAASILTHRKPREAFALHIPRIRDFFAGLLVYGAALIMQSAVTSLLSMISENFTGVDNGIFSGYLSNTPPAAALFVFAIMPAICEELLFRGYAVTTAKVIIGRDGFVIVFTAILFAAMHFNAYKFIPVFICGAALGYIAVRSGSVFICMLMHFINNSMAVASLYMDTPAQTLAEFGRSRILVAAVIMIGVSILLFLLGRLIFNSGRKTNDE